MRMIGISPEDDTPGKPQQTTDRRCGKAVADAWIW